MFPRVNLPTPCVGGLGVKLLICCGTSWRGREGGESRRGIGAEDTYAGGDAVVCRLEDLGGREG